MEYLKEKQEKEFSLKESELELRREELRLQKDRFELEREERRQSLVLQNRQSEMLMEMMKKFK